MPASDLQSQLNDMLDDSASNNSSTLQSLRTTPPPLRPSPPPLVRAPQARGPNPNMTDGNASLQQMLTMPDEEDEDGVQGMLSQQSDFDPQQLAEMSNQLQVSGTTLK